MAFAVGQRYISIFKGRGDDRSSNFLDFMKFFSVETKWRRSTLSLPAPLEVTGMPNIRCFEGIPRRAQIDEGEGQGNLRDGPKQVKISSFFTKPLGRLFLGD